MEGRAHTLGYRRALDGLRGLSVVLVMCFHVILLPGGGFLGVDVFFVLSGFLITNLLLDEWGANGRINLRRFYGRRCRRLLPALVVAVAGFLAISFVTFFPLRLASGHTFGRDVLGALAGVTYVSNVMIASSAHWVDGVQHLWSLAAEEQFYLLWPPVLVGALMLRCPRRVLTGALVVAVVAIWVHRFALTVDGAPQRRLYFSPDTSLDPILLGCLLALLYEAGHVQRAYQSAPFRRFIVPVASAIGAGLILVIKSTDTRWVYTWGLPAFCVAVTIVLGAVVADPESPYARALERWRLPELGRISFGVYLWHPIFLYAAHLPFPLSIPAAIKAAALSNRYVEQRFLRRNIPAAEETAATVPLPVTVASVTVPTRQ
jgi:peptidoglycan/LPS O-acetylase OafA/YrhL